MSNELNGKYLARAVEWAFGEAKTGNHQIAVVFELTETDGRITWFGSLTEKAAPYTMKAMRAMGWDNDDVTNATGLAGYEVELVIAREEYNGELRSKVQFVNKPGVGGLRPTQLDEAAKRAFAARMKAAAVASRKDMPKPETASGVGPQNGAPTQTGEKLPF